MEIVKAIKNKDFDSFKKLINSIDNIENNFSFFERDPSITNNGKDDDFPTSNLSLLHIAAYFNSLEIFQYLQNEKQFPLRLLSQKGYLPLHYACYNGSSDVALYILNEDPEEIIRQGKCKFSLLSCAVIGGNKTIIEELLKKGDKLSDPLNDEYEIITNAIEIHNSDILSLLFPLRSRDYDRIYKNKKCSYSIMAAFSHNAQALEIVYCKEDLKFTFIDRTGYQSPISSILETDVRHLCKEFLLKILDELKETCLEPPEELGLQRGICQWICMYKDIDVAKKMLRTKDVKINRFDREYKTGAFRLAHSKDKQVVDMLLLLIQYGFDINLRYDEKSPTLLEEFLMPLSKNYEAIEILIDYGADVNAFHSKQLKKDGQKMTLYEFAKTKGDQKTKKIFEKLDQ